MVKKLQTTSSSRRFAFQSFRDRVDSIKIDPITDLTRKPYQETDTSFFISALDHWREINLSKNFTALVDTLEPIAASLPQVLFHQEKIFNALKETLLLNDPLSLQATLELLSQFCHDLGPDFLPYYQDTLKTLREIALTQTDADALESIFNALAYVFKYLSRAVSKDLVPTFRELLPLMTLQKKQHITKFTAQAISFLVKKAKSDSLDRFIQYAFEELDNVVAQGNSLSEKSYHAALVTIFADSLKAGGGYLHSKTKLILMPLTKYALQSPYSESVLSDVVMDVLGYASSPENAKPVYETIESVVKVTLDDNEEGIEDYQKLTSVAELLSTLSFAESGVKVPRWDPLFKLFHLVGEKSNKIMVQDDDDEINERNFGDVLSQWAATLMRNADQKSISKNHVSLFGTLTSTNNGDQFLPFVDYATDLCRDKTITFAADSVRSFISRNWKDHHQQIGYFLARMQEKGIIDSLNVVIPQDFKKFTLEFDESKPLDIAWRVSVLDNSKAQVNSSKLLTFLDSHMNTTTDKEKKSSREPFMVDLDGTLLGVLANQKELTSGDISKAIELSLNDFDVNASSTSFLTHFNRLLSRVDSETAPQLLKDSSNEMIQTVSLNLRKPSHEAREQSLNAIISLYQIQGKEAPQTVSSLRVIEQVPLDLQHGRDIQLRFRNLIKEFENDEPSELLNEIVADFVFGQLTVKFSPSWAGVLEFVESTYSKFSKPLWENVYSAISVRYDQQTQEAYLEYDIDNFDPVSDLEMWHTQDTRLLTSMENAENVMQKYETPDQSIVALDEAHSCRSAPTSFSRYQAIKLLDKVPEVAEEHFKDLYPFVMNEDVDEGTTALEGWNSKDRNSLIEVLTHFKRLHKAYKIDDVKELLFRLLMNKATVTQQLALKCLLNLNNPTYNKYAENLNSMLSNTLFSDEVLQFLQSENENSLASEDKATVMPLVLRILFGRALTSTSSGTKQSRKTAAVRAVNGLEAQNIEQFIQLSFNKINFEPFFEGEEISDVTINDLRHINGFINMAFEVTNSLGKSHIETLPILIKPLVYSLAVSEKVIEESNNKDSESMGDDEKLLEKFARNNRKTGTKLLYNLMDRLGTDFDWAPYGDYIYQYLVQPRLERFSEENLQGVSSLMAIMAELWPRENLQFFLYKDDALPVKALLDILSNPNAKDSVLLEVLKFVELLLKNTNQDDEYISLLTNVIASCLNSLVSIFERSSNREVNSLAVKILLSFAENSFITDNESRQMLISSLITALEKPGSEVPVHIKEKIIKILALLVKDYEGSIEDITPLYKTVSKLYQSYEDREMRETITSVFESLGARFSELKRVGTLVSDLNAYSKKRMREADFSRRMDAFQKINQEEYMSLSSLEWLPIVYTSLYFINDETEQAMRTSSSFTLTRFIDSYSSKDEADAADQVQTMKEVVIPALRQGLRNKNDLVRMEYLKVLDHAVANSKYIDEFEEMKPLRHGGDEETNFFKNALDLQVSRRAQVIRALPKDINEVPSKSVAHYVLPAIEHYVFFGEGKYGTFAAETLETISKIAHRLSWKQYRAIMQRYIKVMLNAKDKGQRDTLRDSVRLLVAFSKVLNKWASDEESRPKDYPSHDQLDPYITGNLLPTLKKVMADRDEDTVVLRAPLSEAMVALASSLDKEKLTTELPGILTGISHALRSRNEDLRDALRKHLGHIAVSLGPDYLKFIFEELRSALRRGPQLHILSYTIHDLIRKTTERGVLDHGALGESAEIIINAVMDDIFGASAEEKEAEGYSNKSREIKHNKSYDTGELLAKNLALKDFSHMLTPVKYLSRERLSLKAQNRLDQLMTRVSTGLMGNEEASSSDMLVLCYNLYHEAIEFVKEHERRRPKPVSEKVDHFMVHLDARPQKTSQEYSNYIKTMQKFSFELLRETITKHNELFKTGYLSQFVPILVESLDSDDERVIGSALKVLTQLVRMRFEDDVDAQFTTAARTVLKVLKDMPNMNNDLAQTCLKFLNAVIRNKDDLQLKDSALSYILRKIEPDLDEPQRQGAAFGFVKSLISRHIMLPEIYDTMDAVSRLMVTSTSKEIREVARSVFYTFLMEYDQSRGRLEKQFKMLINNLRYPAQAGRESVMELINQIVNKSGRDLLAKLSSSFFMALANVAITDDSPTCREMATTVIGSILNRMNKFGNDFEFIDKYTKAWIGNKKNDLLVRCGLNVYNEMLEQLGYEHSDDLNAVAMDRITNMLNMAKRKDDEEEDEDDEGDDEDTSSAKSYWQTVYSALSSFESLTKATEMKKEKYRAQWDGIVDSLLYPHSWVRLLSSRLVSKLLEDEGELKLSDEEIQTIAYRSFRQLGAPNISQKLANQIAKNLVLVSKRWIKDETPYIELGKQQQQRQEQEEEDGGGGGGEEKRFDTALEWAINRAAAILKNESRPNREMLVTKKAMIQYIAFLTSILDPEALKTIASEQLLVPLINLADQPPLAEDDKDGDDRTLPALATRCLELICNKLGISEYNVLYSEARKIITERRQERKAKRSQMMLNNPEAATRRKFKKHARFREKRRHHDKDENGLYRTKIRRKH